MAERPSKTIGTVLVADDDSGLRLTARSILEQAGYRVLEAPNGRVAAKILTRDRPDVAVIDWVMPLMTGEELLQQFAQGDNGAPPIVVMTGYASVDLVVEAMRKGARDCLPKPFEEKDLLAKVEQVLGIEPVVEQEASPKRKVRLAKREVDVLLLMREGLTDREIGERMGLGLRTIQSYSERLRRKLGVGTRAGAVGWSYRNLMLGEWELIEDDEDEDPGEAPEGD